MSTLNPLEQKVRSSFLKGLMIATIIGLAIIMFLAYQIYTFKTNEKKRLDAQKKVLVLKQNVSSGEILTSEMFTTVAVDGDVVPSTATKAYTDMQEHFYSDDDGNEMVTYYNEQQQKDITYLKIAAESDATKETIAELHTDDDGQNYYYMSGQKSEGSVENGKTIYYITGDTKVDVKLEKSPMIAKIDLDKNTVITTSMIVASDEPITKDLRTQEISSVVLPTDLADDDVIDIRLRMPDGRDYLVVSKKTVTIPSVGDTLSSSTMVLNLKENEILTLSCATVEAYQMSGSMLYAVKYANPGTQEKAAITYIPSVETLQLIQSDANILKTAKNSLIAYYNNYSEIRKSIDSQINSTLEEERKTAVQSGTSSETSTLSSQRQEYVQSMENSK